jgi:hypothetical protein
MKKREAELSDIEREVLPEIEAIIKKLEVK